MNEKRAFRTGRMAALVVALILVTYSGACFLMVDRWRFDRTYPYYRPMDFLSPWQGSARRLFSPIHWIDKFMIRTHYWGSAEHFNTLGAAHQ